MAAADKTKLDAISPGATANSTDDYLLNRANHTGIQSIATIFDLQNILDAKEPSFTVLPIAKGGTGSSTQNFVDLSNNQTISAIKSFSGGEIGFTNLTRNHLLFNSAGIALPSFATRSVGTKWVLYPNLTATATDYAIGIAAGTFWHTIPQPNTNNKFSWFAGTNEIATLRGDGLFVTSKLIVNSVDAWIIPTLATGWTLFNSGYPTASYRKLPDGTVELKGTIKKSSTPTGGETIFTLPVGYRPMELRIFSTVSNNVLGRIDIAATGAVSFQLGSSAWLSLEGIRYIAEQ